MTNRHERRAQPLKLKCQYKFMSSTCSLGNVSDNHSSYFFDYKKVRAARDHPQASSRMIDIVWGAGCDFGLYFRLNWPFALALYFCMRAPGG